MRDEQDGPISGNRVGGIWHKLFGKRAQKGNSASVDGSGGIAQGDGAIGVGERGVVVQGANPGNINTGTQIQYFVTCYMQGGGAETDARKVEQKLTAYLSWAKQQYNAIPLFSYHPGDKKMRPIPIESAYVTFDAEVESLGDIDNKADLEARLKNLGGRISFERVLMLGPRLVITAGAGIGKSIVLLWLAHALADAIETDIGASADALNLTKPLPVPIYLPLGLYAQHLKQQTSAANAKGGGQSLPRFIDAYLRDNTLGLPSDFFSVLISADTPVVLLLDGLDEIVDEGQREVVSAHVASLSRSKANVRFVVTCRTSAYQRRTQLGDGFIQLKPAPFESQHVQQLVEKAYYSLYDISNREQFREARQRAEDLLKSIGQLEMRRQKQATKPIAPLIDSPLMARLAMIVHSYAGSLPEQRAELLMKAVEALLSADYELDPGAGQWLASQVGGDWRIHRKILQEVAFSMQRDEALEIAERGLQTVLQQDHAQHAATVIQVAKGRGGLLNEWNGRYRFVHPSLQHSLAACHLCSNHDPESLASFLVLGDRITQEWWREVSFLVAGYFTAATNPDRDEHKLAEFLLALAERSRDAECTPANRFACVEVAAQAAVEFLPQATTLRTSLAERMASVMEDRDAMDSASAHTRVAMGNALGKFGDPRGYAMRVDEMRLCYVSAGPFFMGSDQGDPDAFDDEKCIHPDWYQAGYDVTYGYLIGQHPVTTAQYAGFINDHGYDNPIWWDSARRAGVWKRGKIKRRVAKLDAGVAQPQTPEAYWDLVKAGRVSEGEDESDRPWNFDERLREQPNHPVVGLTWYEALAFCQWLEARWRARGWLAASQRVCLPNEPEWEKAARGGLQLPAQAMTTTLAAMRDGLKQTILPAESMNPGPRRRYPWGDEFEPEFANTREIAVGTTCAVGCFANGQSPYACHDMGGNVSEWTRSLYGFKASILSDARLEHSYPYDLDDGRESIDAGPNIARVLRGGAFDGFHRGARVACRNRPLPDFWFAYFGFRVVVSPISL
jgi:formylglycine-generating enzyme required for sulfatase activity